MLTTNREEPTVPLIRHNVRTGGNQPIHVAHDTEVPDVEGTHVSGRTDKVWTSQSRPCSQCGGYGALVPIVQLPRAEYPQGSVVPENYRLTGTTALGTLDPVSEPWYDCCQSRGSHRLSCHNHPINQANQVPMAVPMVSEPYVPPVERVAPATSTVTDEQAAKDMATAMLSALVPEAARIRETITEAVNKVQTDAAAANVASIQSAIDQLSANFDETVRRLIVPVTIRIERKDREPVTLAGSVHNAFSECLDWLQQGRNVYLVGPAGSGKTTLAEHLATALDVAFYTTGQVLAPWDVQGFTDAGGTFHETAWYAAFTRGGLHLADEMDGWSPEATLAMNGALANGRATFPNSPVPVDKHSACFAVGAGNTWGAGGDREYVGRNEMDAAARKRWVFIPVDYDLALETQIAGQYREWLELVWRCRENARGLKVREIYGTRELAYGVDALAEGMDPELVALRLLRGNMDDAQWAKVSA